MPSDFSQTQKLTYDTYQTQDLNSVNLSNEHVLLCFQLVKVSRTETHRLAAWKADDGVRGLRKFEPITEDAPIGIYSAHPTYFGF